MEHLTNIIRKRAVLVGIGAIIALGGAGVAAYHMAANVNAQPTAAAPPPPQVGVVTVKPQNVRIWSEFSGRMRAVDFAELRPEVSGRITGVRFKEGQIVKAGEVLFVIDPRPYEAAVAKAEANLVTARTNAGFARTERERAANMVQTQAIAQRLYDERANADRVARAAIQVAEAELKQARIDLDHAYVKAPIGGRVSRAEITLGNRVQAGAGAPLLTSIVSNDGIYADFEVDEQTYMSSIRAHADTPAKERQVRVEVTVQGDEAHPYQGTIQSFDNRIDPASGTIRARARFDNKNGALVPGMFVAVRLASSSENAALLVPERAIGTDQSKRFVYVVGDNDKVAYREVRLGQQARGERIVLAGVRPGDRVIVDGVQHVRPDSTVRVQEVAQHQEPDRLAAK
ncbi:efflux RND transporter periplasmic adaptor subunit [Oryzomonas japonica]|uniref:Efflux RND transporter periplasmic adaptor subunit n=1 Tax=Oryzomonas japonica TaxID=2603858 RepID=A0A7J4ZMQ5_9BACT|nr:efflux RND transporter periplasmic adaptor subunit [Oryzomonas japonica]KAB0663983.1 efflux RND transporter periplasmic adaptor subunit [Oryzomonas japonica]